MATVETDLMTAEEFFDWAGRPENEDKLFELEFGEIVEMPNPSELHGVVCALIAHLLWTYIFGRGKGYVCSNDSGLLVARGPDTVRGPDLMLFDESRSLDALSRKFTERIPKLIVEVLSPSDQMTKVNLRISQFLKRGVPLAWLVDPDARRVTVYRPGKEHTVVDETEELTGEGALADLRVRVADLFAMPERKS
jgi:Uma2 family endonuclease